MSGWNQEQEYQAGVRDERASTIKLLESFLDCEACADGDVASDCSPGMARFLIDVLRKKTSDTSS